MTTDAVRPGIFDVSTRVSGAWTFRSGAGDTRIPLGSIRFLPWLDPANTAPAKTPYLVPIRVEGMRPRTLAVEVSHDEGRTWQRADVVAKAVVVLRHPAGTGSVSLRAKASGHDGHTVELTVIRAYKLATSQAPPAGR